MFAIKPKLGDILVTASKKRQQNKNSVDVVELKTWKIKRSRYI
jgi:hypothetical protein